jgi:hypothetical protein
LLDKTWRAGHPFGRRLSGGRRWGIALLFVVLVGLIAVYMWVTDATRVRGMAQQYLTELLGGKVQIGSASLTIFQGLKLENVTLWVDWPQPNGAVDHRMLFKAQTLSVDYNPAVLMAGRIEATRIIATDPSIELSQDVQSKRWSYETLRLKERMSSDRARAGARPLVLPEILLRNAHLNYSQRDLGKFKDFASFAVEGSLTPTGDADVYGFSLQTRSKNQGEGPAATGSMDMRQGVLRASISNFVFGSDLKAMLPYDVQQWCDAHRLSGHLDVPELMYRRGSALVGSKDTFRAVIALGDATMQVAPEEWLGEQEVQRMAWTRAAVGGLAVGPPDSDFWSSDRVERMRADLVPSPITLQHAEGNVTFTESGIALDISQAQIEDNSLKITGQIDGYAAGAVGHFEIASPEGKDLVIPPTPHYVSSMPAGIREIYDRFRPEGRCRLNLKLDRNTPDGAVLVNGIVEIVAGKGVFENFTYPVRVTGGKLILSADAATGAQKLTFSHISGRGIEGGPNADAILDVDGWMGPLGPETVVDVVVSGQGVHAEPALLAAFPRGTQDALAFFDAPGKGQYPTFSGSFRTQVRRIPTRTPHWSVETDVHVDDASAIPAAFPCLLEHASGDLLFRGDQVSIENGKFRRGSGHGTVGGIVSWGAAPGEPGSEHRLRPDVRITTTGVPIDDGLIAALPEEQRDLLAGWGLTGLLDLDGKITEPKSTHSLAGLNLELAVREGTIRSHGSAQAGLSALSGKMKLTENGVTIEDVRAMRGPAELHARGKVDWTGGPALLDVLASATNVALDTDLYNMLPAVARHGWDELHPTGSIDATASYQGLAEGIWKTPTTGPTTQPTIGPTTAPTEVVNSAAADPPASHYSVTIVPRQLGATPQAAPYRLDNVTGRIVLHDGAVQFEDIKAHHGNATVALDGGSAGPDVWDFSLHLGGTTVDDDLLTALPSAVSDLAKSVKFSGAIALDVNKLHIAPHVGPLPPPSPGPPGSPPPPPTTEPAGPPQDVDFDLACHTDNGSLDIGAPMEKTVGGFTLAGSVVAGKAQQLNGSVDVTSALIASRQINRFKAVIQKESTQDIIRIGEVQAQLAGGQLAGEVDFQVPDNGPGRYAMALVLRDADVKQLMGNEAKDVRGRLAVSLSLSGFTGNPFSRQGRGDLSVTGQQMYKMPLVLGLLQVTNLALPISEPFSEGTARYSVSGMKVTFDDIELRSKGMIMQGNGSIFYDTHQVRMTFFTDNTNVPKLPVVGDLIQATRRELLQIHVRGTVQDPQVSAGVADTFTTTIDEVLRGGTTTQPETEKQSAKPKRYGY